MPTPGIPVDRYRSLRRNGEIFAGETFPDGLPRWSGGARSPAVETSLIRADGKSLEVEVTARPNTLSGTIREPGLVRDITESKNPA